MPPKFINVNFWTKKYRKMQSKSGTPKIDLPKIDAFFKFWPLWKCVNLWRRTVYGSYHIIWLILYVRYYRIVFSSEFVILKHCKDIKSIRKITLQVNSKEKVFVEDVSIESSKMKLIFPLRYEFDDGIKVAQALK